MDSSQTQPDPISFPSSPFNDSTNASGTKRLHPAEELTATGCSKKSKVDLLNAAARHIARVEDAFISPFVLFDFGSNYKTPEPGAAKPTIEQKRWLHVYDHLKQKVPHFEQRIRTGDDEDWQHHTAEFKAGLSAARSDDVSSLKGAVIDWLMEAPYNASAGHHTLQRNQKTTRGFNNPVIGELLCPTDLQWTDQAVQDGLRDGNITVDPSQWPSFLYKDCETPSDGEDMWPGLFRHPLLVKTVKHLFTSPSSVNGDEGARGTRASKASMHGMTNMTVGAIAYAAMQLRHALSSNQTFNKHDNAQNEGFYYGLLEVLEHPAATPDVSILLDWYDRQVFPNAKRTKQAPATSALSRMRAQMAALS